MTERRARKKPLKPYDIGLEQIRAQGQGIYESCVLRHLKQSGAPLRTFRDPSTGARADLLLDPATRRELITSCMFQMGTGVAQKHGRLTPGTRTPTAKALAESAERIQPGWADKLLRNRQDYEETLALARTRGGFYRVVPESAAAGLRYFVWPLPPGCVVPGPASADGAVAAEMADRFNQALDPRVTGVWWVPPRLAVSPERLAHWLPRGVSGPSAARVPKKRRAG